jgi:murein L,D-transpeptidase YcbB/YkuD
MIVGCSGTQKKIEQSFLKNDKLSEKQKLIKVLDVDYLHSLQLSENEINWLRKVYINNEYKRFFSTDSTLKEIAFDLQSELNHSIWYGIPKNRIIHPNKKLHPLEKEVVLMLNFGKMISDLNNGFFDFENKKMKEPILDLNTSDLLKQIDTISFSRLLLKQGPADTNYRFLAYNIHQYGRNHLIDTINLKLKTSKENPENAFEEAKTAMIKKGRLKENADSLDFIKGLKEFQLENGLDPDGKLGKNTIYAINECTYDKMLRASLALDRLRSKKVLPEKYVRINIPEFQLYFFAKDTLRNIHRIIVGKQENQTPPLESRIYKIICYPYWKVPTSIANKEILPAVKANSNYLTKNHYKIYRGKELEVNPLNVNWSRYSSFPYTVIQQPGTFNSLGIIKFEFNNAFSVYVHDTPKKNLFNTVFRSYSHGCMRCEKPVDLAKEILSYDSIRKKGNPFSPDTLDTLLTEVKNRSIPLLQAVPIFIVYETVVAEKDRLIFHLDLYRREEELVKILKGGK